MKAKRRLLHLGFLIVVIVIGIYLFNVNDVSKEYSSNNKNISTANYLEAETIGESIEENIETVEEPVVIDEPEIVYDGLTLDQLAQKLDKSLNSAISGKGYLIASSSIDNGVDPYMATAIILHETGCSWECSRLVKECNNVGGQKGYGCGSYSYFNSLDEGIKAFINNLKKNYIDYGLYTPEQINPKYAEDRTWAKNVNKYIEIIKAQ